jgi:hypothetical protein
MLKALLIGAGIVVVLVVATAQGESLALKLVSSANSFSIQNVGTDPITILDVVVNDRDDCSTVNVERIEAFVHTQYATADGMARLDKIKKSSKEDLHKLWVFTGGSLDVQLDFSKPYIALPAVIGEWPDKPKTLKVGDAEEWDTICNIVRVSVKTDRGSATYSLAN